MTLLLVDGFYSPLKLDRNGFDRGLLLSIWDKILSKIHVEYIHNSIIIFFLKSKESQNHVSYLLFSQVTIGHVEDETRAMAMLF